MRRLKIVVSDFHMGEGRILPDGSVNNLEDFISDQAFIDLMEYYRTGEYTDDEVELILNGDIFEGLVVDPTAEGADEITERKSVEKIERIVKGHGAMFQAMRVFAASEQRGVTFVVGNHDQDLLWEGVQARLRERIHPSVGFVHGPYRFDGVHVEHGNDHELGNRIDPSKLFLTKGLAEPILNLPWGSDFFINCLMRMKKLRAYVNRVRPFRLAVWWTLVHDFRALLLGLWYFFAAIFRARLRRSRQRRITILKTLRVMFSMSAFPTLEPEAARLLDADASVHTVIFGHTHIPLARHPRPGRSYINSGTWIPNSNLHISALGRNLLQTYVYIEYEGKAPRARLKLWRGRRLVEEDIVL
jgi:UDP-2,3-diacylglucosamine pyrophosphatase LpxH